MKSLLIFAILFAACGYGAFTHFSAEEEKITQLGKRKEKAGAEAAETSAKIDKLRPEAETLKRSLAETLATVPAAELAKARAELTAKRDGLLNELEAAKVAAEAAAKGPEDLALELADLTAQIEATTANIQKLNNENLKLMKYRAAEEAATPKSTPASATKPKRRGSRN